MEELWVKPNEDEGIHPKFPSRIRSQLALSIIKASKVQGGARLKLDELMSRFRSRLLSRPSSRVPTAAQTATVCQFRHRLIATTLGASSWPSSSRTNRTSFGPLRRK